MQKQQAIKLAQKVLALSKHGIGGEKNAAALKLKEIMQRYNLSASDIEDNIARWTAFKVTRDTRTIFVHVASKVLNMNAFHSRNRPGTTIIYLEVTEAQAVEIQYVYDLMKKAYKEALEEFAIAFCIKNHLFADKQDEKTEKEPMSLEDRQRSRRIAQMLDGIEKTKVRKAIES